MSPARAVVAGEAAGGDGSLWAPLAGSLATLLVPPVSAGGLEQALTPETRLIVETTQGKRIPEAGLIGAAAEWQQVLMISSATAFQLPVPSIVTAALRRLTAAPELTLQSVELALHEAVANAIMHGNFGIPSLLQPEVAAFDAYLSLLSERLATASLAQRPLLIMLGWNGETITISVGDSGEGFTRATAGSLLEPAGPAPAGRGVTLMQSLAHAVTFSDGGRRVTLVFRFGPAGSRGGEHQGGASNGRAGPDA